MMCDISLRGGRTFLTITASGDMVPASLSTKEFSGGNIFKTSIEKAMNSKPFKTIRAGLGKIVNATLYDFRHICGSPCLLQILYPEQYVQKGRVCEFYKEVIRYAFKLISKIKFHIF